MHIIQTIQNRIHEIRGERVIMDRDLAALYEVETKALNLAVKRNSKRFPKDFMFQLTKEEFESLRFQFETSEKGAIPLRLQLEPHLGEHDVQLSQIYDAIENLLDEKAAQRKWDARERIGFKK